VKRLILIAALTLSACAHRPVTTPCIAKDQAIPQEPEQVGDKLTGQADRDFQIVAGSAARLRAWGRSLNGIVEACRG
jgi:hypothetical protein